MTAGASKASNITGDLLELSERVLSENKKGQIKNPTLTELDLRLIVTELGAYIRPFYGEGDIERIRRQLHRAREMIVAQRNFHEKPGRYCHNGFGAPRQSYIKKNGEAIEKAQHVFNSYVEILRQDRTFKDLELIR